MSKPYRLYHYTDIDKLQMRQHSQKRSSPTPQKENPYIVLLRESGVDITDELLEGFPPDTVEPRQLESLLPTMPIGWSQEGIPYFSTRQLSWAKPEDYGFDVYEVVESSATFALSWAEENSLPKRRPVHRYNRLERFRLVLNQLMLAQSACIPCYIMDKIPKLPKDCDLWEEMRKYLKDMSLRKYYNRIPAILCKLGYCKYTLYRNSTAYADILDDFKDMNCMFQQSRKSLKRVYFPNLRYVCTKLMQKHNVEIPLNIPQARTVKKSVSLDETWKLMWEGIEITRKSHCSQ